MQLLKDIHSLLGTYEPGGTQARPEQVGSLSSTVAEEWAQSQQRPNLEPQGITQKQNKQNRKYQVLKTAGRNWNLVRC